LKKYFSYIFRVISATYDQDQLWQSAWVWNGFWHALYFIILVAIVILWRPTQNNSRYAYSEMPTEEEIALSELSTSEDLEKDEIETSGLAKLS
jgi:hypothetical protein